MTLADADALYQPVRTFSEWADRITSSALFNDYVAQWEAAKSSASPVEAQAAVDYALRSAALETGAIEGLYQTTRGVTLAVAMQAAAWQTKLDELGDHVRGHFEAQLEAFETILDVATGAKPLTEQWIRELHEVSCRHQHVYRVLSDVGWQDRPLRHGSYKEEPNHVLLADGSTHAYCPVIDVRAELRRLFHELETPQFASSPPVVQTAYFHHGLTSIHPFSDGNGRVARAAGSVFLYRSAGIPLVIFADQSDRYLDALEAADGGQSQAFVQFVEDRALDALGVLRQRLAAARHGRPEDRLRQLAIAHGGLSHDEVETVGRRLLEMVRSESEAYLDAHALPNVTNSFGPMAQRCTFGRPYHSPPHENGFKVTLHCSEPVSVETECTPMLGIADDIAERFVYTMIDANRPNSPPLQMRLDEVYPEATQAGGLNVQTWVEATLGHVLAELADNVERGLSARGYRSKGRT